MKRIALTIRLNIYKGGVPYMRGGGGRALAEKIQGCFSLTN